MLNVTSVLNYVPRIPSCLCFLRAFFFYEPYVSSFFYLSSFLYLLYLPLYFLHEILVFTFYVLCLSSFFYEPSFLYMLYMPSFFTRLTCLHFLLASRDFISLRVFIFYVPSVFQMLTFHLRAFAFLYAFIFFTCLYFLLSALSFSRTLLVFIF